MKIFQIMPRFCQFIVYFLSFLGGICTLQAQSVSGVVISKGQPVTGASLKNLRTGKLVPSGSDGRFMIVLKKGDTLLTSHLGFQNDTLAYKGAGALTITLEPTSNILNEIVVRTYRMNPLEKFQKNQEEYKQIYRIGNNKKMVSVGGGYNSVGVGLSIDALYSALSKEGKDARRLQRTLERDYRNDVVDRRYTKALVAEITGYQGKHLDSFFFENRPDYEFIKNASDYDIISYIKERAKRFVYKDSTITIK